MKLAILAFAVIVTGCSSTHTSSTSDVAATQRGMGGKSLPEARTVQPQ